MSLANVNVSLRIENDSDVDLFFIPRIEKGELVIRVLRQSEGGVLIARGRDLALHREKPL